MAAFGFDLLNLKYLIASFAATYCSALTHPLDVVKTRLQSHDGKTASDNLIPKYQSLRHAFTSIYRNQGLQGLFKGFYISLICQATATSFFFWIYEVRKNRYERRGFQKMNAVTLASIQAGVIATLATQPAWVVKTRMLLNVNKGVSEYQNCKIHVMEIFQQHGMRGYMKGIQLSLVLSSVGVIQMYLYEGGKLLYQKIGIPESKWEEKHLICGGLSKMASVLFSYPLTTIRTRVQQNQFLNNRKNMKYSGGWDVLRRSWGEQGLGGLFKGMSANLLRGVGQKGIYFYCYELFKGLMSKSQKERG